MDGKRAGLDWNRFWFGLDGKRADLDRNRFLFGLDGRELIWIGTDFCLVWMEESLFGLDDKMAALVGWEDGCLKRTSLVKTRRGLVWFGWEEL